MADFYFDTSGLVKNYVIEVGSGWVSGIVHPKAGHRITISRITTVEIISAFVRRGRVGGLSAPDLAAALGRFRLDLRAVFDISELSGPLIDRAMILAETHSLRGYDAVQLASALVAHDDSLSRGSTLTLISADLELNAAATAEGLAVDDPNNHP